MVNAAVTSANALFSTSGLNFNQMRSNELLRTDEWKSLDSAVVQTFKQRLNVVGDLINAGLTKNEGSLGVMLSQWEDITDMSAANQDMGGTTPGEEDKLVYDLNSVPIPITHKDFRLNIRFLEASRREPRADLDTTYAQAAARKVRDKLEDMVVNGSDVKLNGNSIYGLTNHPSVNTTTISNAWDGSSGTPVADVEAMLQAQYDDNSFGPFVLYIPKNYWSVMQQDYNDYKSGMVIDRLKAYSEIQDVKPCDVLDDDNVLLVQMTSDVVDLAISQDIITLQWEAHGGLTTLFKVMAAMVPRVKADSSGASGICLASTS
jgi:uncharacterized linocin/CFP29 family protein